MHTPSKTEIGLAVARIRGQRTPRALEQQKRRVFGLPPLPDNRKGILVRVDEGERDQIKAAADAAGLTLQCYCRETLLKKVVDDGNQLKFNGTDSSIEPRRIFKGSNTKDSRV